MPRKTSPRLSEAFREFQSVRGAYVAPTTLTNDASVIGRFVAGVGDPYCHVLSARIVERYFSTVAVAQQPRSFNKCRSRVNTFLAFCARRGWVEGDPLAEVRPRKVVKRERLRLSPQELLDLSSFAPTARDRAFLEVAVNTALRASEICTLRVRDVDLVGGGLRVRIQKSALEDVMPITVELDAALRTWLKTYEEECGPLDPDWLLIPSRGSGHNGFGPKGEVLRYVYGPLKPLVGMKRPASVVQQALIDAGIAIERGEGVHTLRRSVARAFFDKAVAHGYDAALRATSALLHHSSSQVTELYLGLTSEKLSRDEILRGRECLTSMTTRREVMPIAV
jgi:integrase